MYILMPELLQFGVFFLLIMSCIFNLLVLIKAISHTYNTNKYVIKNQKTYC